MHRKPTLVLITCLFCAFAAVLLVRAEAPTVNPAAATVLSLRDFELRPGVAPAEFEKFVCEEMAGALCRNLHGLKIQVLKGDRGERKSRYVLIWEFDSVATRDRFFPREGGWTCGPAFAEAWPQLKPVMEKFNGFVKVKDGYTDYVMIVP